MKNGRLIYFLTQQNGYAYELFLRDFDIFLVKS